MSEQNKPYLDRALMVETLGKLAEQLALCEEDPNIQTTKALVATQAELSDLKNEVAGMKQMIQTLRSLYSPPYSCRTQKLLIADIWHISKSDRTEHMIPEPVPAETLSEATRKMMQEYPISWSSVGTMDSQTLRLLLALLGRPTNGTDKKRQIRLRNALDLKNDYLPDEDLDTPAVAE
ncbi:hypothetical protein BKA56DRAFT_625220 [Ilyonectria sp. MPI-CAGE-AT-0026]|nr:hypothetical protein BKA56DRAFT_625220 [Ilyonectria sp. MPI-CAGE-AT-0026]